MVSEEKGEATMVCIDNSKWMMNGPVLAAQLDAFKLYSRTKLASNPNNTVGALTISSKFFGHSCKPTTDLDELFAFTKGILRGGDMSFKAGMEYAAVHVAQKTKQRRLLIFFGSPFTFGMPTAERYGIFLKANNIAVDVVNFCVEEKYKSVLEAFVGFVNHKNNSHIKHVQPGSCIRDVLSRTPAFITRVSIEEEDLALAAAAAADLKRTSRLSAKKNHLKQFSKANVNQAPPPAHDEFIEPKRIPLKLVNKFEALSLEETDPIFITMVSEEKGEATMVCIDNSKWMMNGPVLAAQLDAFKLYSRTKLASNPNNTVGALTISSKFFGHSCKPTTDLDELFAFTKGILRGGDMSFKAGMEYAAVHVAQKTKQRRLLIFFGSPFTFGMPTAERYGIFLKANNIAVDVVNFCVEEKYKSVLEAFVGFVNHKNNSHIKHVQPGSCIRDVLSRTPAFITRVSIEEEDLALAAAAAADLKRTSRLSAKKNHLKQFSKANVNQAPPPAHDEFIEPKRIPLKLVNKFEALSLEE